MHDTELSYDQEENNSVFALFDSNGRVDYTRIECDMTIAEITLELVQVAELNEEVVRNRSQIKELRNICLKKGKQLTLTILEDGSFDMYWNRKLISSSANLL